MHWQELSWTVEVRDQPLLEEHLEAQGAMAFSARSANTAPSFETWPGEAPSWERVRVIALFDAATATDTVQQAIHQELGHRIADPERRRFADRDWVQDWTDGLQTQQFGKRLWVVPTHCSVPPDADKVIRLDPGISFGSGTHETTSMCLEWLVEQQLQDTVVVDYGCGSGILAIASLVLGAERAVACDIDPQALDVARANAKCNGVAAQLEVFSAEAMPAIPCDVLLANILLDALLQLAPTFADHVRPGGFLVLSGILSEQVESLLEVYRQDFEDLTVQTSHEWVRVVARRKPPS